jgi:hypothetical protein
MKNTITPRLPFLATAGFILLFSGCMLYEHVSTEPVAKTIFSNYHTYGWMDSSANSCDKIPDTMPIKDLAEGLVEQELISHGYSFDSEYPDLLLRIFVCNKKIEEFPAHLYPWSFSFISQGLPGDQLLVATQVLPQPFIIETQADFLKSTITLFVYDRQKGKLIWCGSTMQEIYYLSEVIPVTRKSIRALMEKYPAKLLHEKMANL